MSDLAAFGVCVVIALVLAVAVFAYWWLWTWEVGGGVSDAARGYDAAAMIHVTDQLTQLHDSAVTRETKRVVNRGANPVDVSTDPALVFGQGLTVAAAGGEDTVELQPGERLFGICGAALATDVAVV